LNWVFSIGGEFPKFGALITSTIVFLIYKFSVFGKVIGFVGSMIKGGLVSALSSLASTAPPAGKAIGGGLEAAGRGAKRGALGFLAIGAAIALIGVGIGIAAFGFSKLVLAFKELSGEQAAAALSSIIAIMVGFTIAVVALAFVAAKASLPIGLLGLALLSVAASVAIIGAGIALTTSSIGNLVESFSKLDSENLDNFIEIFSDKNINQINKFAEAISKLNSPFSTLNDNLKNIVSNMTSMLPSMNMEVTATPVSLETAATGFETVTNTTNSIINNTRNTSQQTLIPAQQTTAFVPLVVQIDKKTIIEILKEDIANISKGQALDAIDAIGLTQSGFFSMDRISVGNNER